MNGSPLEARDILVFTRDGFRLEHAPPLLSLPAWWILLGVARDVVLGPAPTLPEGT